MESAAIPKAGPRAGSLGFVKDSRRPREASLPSSIVSSRVVELFPGDSGALFSPPYPLLFPSTAAWNPWKQLLLFQPPYLPLCPPLLPAIPPKGALSISRNS